MTLLDLDAAGLDPTQPAPVEFVQFLYDNSRSGYLTLWSARLGEPDMPSRITRWLNDALTVYHARSLQTQMAPVGDKPAGANVTEVTYSGSTTPAAPVCIDVPAITGTGIVGSTLQCTMGNWGNEPTSYAYQWKSDIAEVGDGSMNYVVVEGDAGKSITCIVTATNAGGSTAAPPSNAIAIPGAAADASAHHAHAQSSSHTSSTTGRNADERSGDDTKVSRTAPKERTTSRDA
jgi:hypothetical protein